MAVYANNEKATSGMQTIGVKNVLNGYIKAVKDLRSNIDNFSPISSVSNVRSSGYHRLIFLPILAQRSKFFFVFTTLKTKTASISKTRNSHTKFFNLMNIFRK